MPRIDYSADQTQHIANLQQYIEAELQRRGIEDEGIYLAALDGTSVDPALLKDPVFQAYWQLTYLKLLEIVEPKTYQAVQAEVEEVDFQAVFSRVDPKTNEFLQNLVLDDPSLMGFAAMTDESSETDPVAILAYLTQNVPPPSAASTSSTSGQYVDHEARALGRQLGLTGGMWDWLIGTEEGMRSTENGLLGMLAEMDNELFALAEGLRSGKISAEEFQAAEGQIGASRQIIVGLIQNMEDAISNMFRVFSQLLESQERTQAALIQNSTYNA